MVFLPSFCYVKVSEALSVLGELMCPLPHCYSMTFTAAWPGSSVLQRNSELRCQTSSPLHFIYITCSGGRSIPAGLQNCCWRAAGAPIYFEETGQISTIKTLVQISILSLLLLLIGMYVCAESLVDVSRVRIPTRGPFPISKCKSAARLFSILLSLPLHFQSVLICHHNKRRKK